MSHVTELVACTSNLATSSPYKAVACQYSVALERPLHLFCLFDSYSVTPDALLNNVLESGRQTRCASPGR